MREYNCTDVEREKGYVEAHEELRTRVIDCSDLAKIHKDCFIRPMDTENYVSITVSRMVLTK